MIMAEGDQPEEDGARAGASLRGHHAVEHPHLVQLYESDERKELEEALRSSHSRAEASAARTELLYRLARVIIDAERVDDVLTAALDVLEEAVGANRSSILVFDEEGVMRFRAWRGLSEAYRRAVEGHSPWTRDTKSPAPIFVRDVEEDAALAPFLPVFHREGIGALAFVPLVAAGRLLGKFMVYYPGRRAPSASELDLAMAIANHVASAVTRFAAADELQRTVRFNEMFTAILGHDLRNPLAGITSAAQLLLLRESGDKVVKPLRRILRSSERMARMIDQLLDFTRARVGAGISLHPQPVDLVPLLRHVLDELGDANPAFPLHLEHAGDTAGTWDEDRLFQVFSNLVGNAVVHGVPEQGARVRVDGTSAAGVRVDVHNMGAVPAELLPRLFEPMTGRRDRSSGLGLGVFITQQIARAHGGTLGVRSDEAEGTTFTLSLPRVAAAPERAREMKILIVDDEEGLRETLQEVFEDEGYLVETACNGAEALAILGGADAPGVVILDLLMPVVDGCDVYARMQRDPRLARIPVIISTSDPSQAPSGVPVLKKPVDLGRLLGAVRRACAGQAPGSGA